MSESLQMIQRTVERTAGGPVVHLESVPITETFKGKTVWQGMVEVFMVKNPPPYFAYGWMATADESPDYVAVLGRPPVTSALAAVRVWIVSQGKK